MRILTYKNHRDKKLTLDEVKQYIDRANESRKAFELKPLEYKLSVDGENESKKINGYLRQARIAKSSYFGGNN